MLESYGCFEAEWLPTEVHSEALAPTVTCRNQWKMTGGLQSAVPILPYISGLLETVKRNLRPLDIRVAFRPHSTLKRQLVHLKDPVPMDQRTGVVYQIPCSECPKVYI